MIIKKKEDEEEGEEGVVFPFLVFINCEKWSYPNFLQFSLNNYFKNKVLFQIIMEKFFSIKSTGLTCP
jgi:hypothetical protein